MRSDNLCAGIHSPPRDFGIHESKPTGIFDAMGAIGSIAFAFNTVILPELQVTALTAA